MVSLRYTLLGVGGIAVLVSIAVLAVAVFFRAFSPAVPVTVRADRSGLIMEPGAEVKMRGKEVGTVAEVTEQGGDAVLTLELDPAHIEHVPANVRARILPTTIFGAKFVSLAEPPDPTAARISAGAVIEAEDVTVEVNTAFENLVAVLQTIDPAKLNATLSALASTLDGRGEQLGRTLVAAGDYLAKLNPNLPTLQRDLAKTADVTNLYADVAPELLAILDNLTVTADTVVDEQAALDALLADLTMLGGQVGEVLAENADQLVTVLDVLRPTTRLLFEYSPELTCFITGLNNLRHLLEAVIGGRFPGIHIQPSFLPGQEVYHYPEDLPVVGADNGPSCYGLPLLGADEIPHEYVDTDTGTDIFPNTTNRLEPGERSLVTYLFGPLVTGTAGEVPQ